MENEEKKVEVISKEDIERLLESIDEAHEKHNIEEATGVDLSKVKEVLSGLEGCSVYTVISLLSTAMLLLPTKGITVVLEMGKDALKTKFITEFAKMMGNTEDSKEESTESVS